MSFDFDDVGAEGEMMQQPSTPVFFIGVVAELTGTHPQTLRNYERMGLLQPGRSQGSVRMFSARDVARVRRIRRLTQDLGVNLAGGEGILNLTEKMEAAHVEHERRLVETEDRYRVEIQRLKKMLQRVTR